MKRVTLAVPVYNEEEAIGPFRAAIEELRDELARRFEGGVRLDVLFVNDGSSDSTVERILSWRQDTTDVALIDLTRNFGKEAALTAALIEAEGDAVVPIDVDLQDPPALIADMVEHWLNGAELVLARRTDRSEDSLAKRSTARWFYRLHNSLAKIQLPENVGDFRLMDRSVVDAVNALPENRRFMKGIFAWVGFTPVFVDYKRPVRSAGKSSFSFWKLWLLAIESITSFSAVPLIMWTYIGLMISMLSLAYACFIVARTFVFGVDVPGYASLLTGILFLGGIQILGIGVLGEYVSSIYSEVKRRPTYLVRTRHGLSPEGSETAKTTNSKQRTR